MPAAVFHGLVRRYPIPPLTAETANRVMGEFAPLIERVVADWEEFWDGHNMVARLGDDAQAAEAQIEAQLGVGSEKNLPGYPFFPDELVVEWTISEGGLDDSVIEEFGIAASTSDDRLDEIAARITRQFADSTPSGVVVVDGLEEFLRDMRTATAV